MKFRHKIAAGLAALVVGAGLSGAAQAHMGSMGGHRGPCGGDHEARLAGMIAYAEKKLDITAAQRGAWTTFAQSVRDASKPMEALCADMKGEPPKDIDAQLARREKAMSAALDGVRTLRPAVAKLSEQLTPEQREKLNAILPRRGMAMGGEHRRWGHH
jgi:Spy/CpxP family protein refolding chaperone